LRSFQIGQNISIFTSEQLLQTSPGQRPTCLPFHESFHVIDNGATKFANVVIYHVLIGQGVVLLGNEQRFALLEAGIALRPINQLCKTWNDSELRNRSPRDFGRLIPEPEHI